MQDEDEETEYEITEKLEEGEDGGAGGDTADGFPAPQGGFQSGAGGSNFTPWIPPPARNPSREHGAKS